MRKSLTRLLGIALAAIAGVLCAAAGFLVWDAGSDLQRSLRGERTTAADRILFESMQTIRARRIRPQILLLTTDSPRAEIETVYAEMRTEIAEVAAAVRSATLPNPEALARDIEAKWQAIAPGYRTVLEEAAKPRAERTARQTEPWYRAVSALLDTLGDVSQLMANQTRMTSALVGELIAVRQMSWNVRDFTGRECSSARTVITTGRRFSPEQWTRLHGDRGAADLGWQVLRETVARPGVTPALRAATESAIAIAIPRREQLNAAYARLESANGTPVMNEAAWNQLCNAVYDPILAIGTVALDLARDAAQADVADARTRLGFASALLVVALALVTFTVIVLVRRFARPIRGLTAAVATLSAGDYATKVPSTGYDEDELGRLATALERLRVSAERSHALEAAAHREAEEKERRRAAVDTRIAQFNATLEGLIGDNLKLAGQMQATSQELSAASGATSQRCAAVAAASEEASGNVQTVAAAAEELTASIGEINTQITRATQIAGRAVNEVTTTSETVSGLSSAAEKIGDVVKLINDIAGRTNLLALNATIEAARAGEAGKGFAVVASEVKALASQTAKATEEIATQIAAIQTASRGSVAAIANIRTTIDQIHESATNVAGAIEEQTASTAEIARNVQAAAKATTETSSNIASVNAAAEGTARASADVQAVALELKSRADTLRGALATFVADLKAA